MNSIKCWESVLAFVKLLCFVKSPGKISGFRGTPSPSGFVTPKVQAPQYWKRSAASEMLYNFNSKDKVLSGLKSKIVYLYSCHRCSMPYIGATKRHLHTRVNEHLEGKPTPTKISMRDHELKKENFKIIDSFNPPFILESILLKNNSNLPSNNRTTSFFLCLHL